MPTTSSVFRLNQASPALPCRDNLLNGCARDSWMIDESNQQTLRVLRNTLNAASDRFAHFAFRIRVERKTQFVRFKMLLYFIRAMAHHDDDLFHVSTVKIVDACLDYRDIAKRKERFESAHAARAAGGEQKCGDILHGAKITTKTLWHKGFSP